MAALTAAASSSTYAHPHRKSKASASTSASTSSPSSSRLHFLRSQSQSSKDDSAGGVRRSKRLSVSDSSLFGPRRVLLGLGLGLLGTGSAKGKEKEREKEVSGKKRRRSSLPVEREKDRKVRLDQATGPTTSTSLKRKSRLGSGTASTEDGSSSSRKRRRSNPPASSTSSSAPSTARTPPIHTNPPPYALRSRSSLSLQQHSAPPSPILSPLGSVHAGVVDIGLGPLTSPPPSPEMRAISIGRALCPLGDKDKEKEKCKDKEKECVAGQDAMLGLGLALGTEKEKEKDGGELETSPIALGPPISLPLPTPLLAPTTIDIPPPHDIDDPHSHSHSDIPIIPPPPLVIDIPPMLQDTPMPSPLSMDMDVDHNTLSPSQSHDYAYSQEHQQQQYYEHDQPMHDSQEDQQQHQQQYEQDQVPQRPARQRQPGLWVTACKMRVWEVQKLYPPAYIRSVVAAEAQRYFQAHGHPPRVWTVSRALPLHPSRRKHNKWVKLLGGASKDKKRPRALSLPPPGTELAETIDRPKSASVDLGKKRSRKMCRKHRRALLLRTSQSLSHSNNVNHSATPSPTRGVLVLSPEPGKEVQFVEDLDVDWTAEGEKEDEDEREVKEGLLNRISGSPESDAEGEQMDVDAAPKTSAPSSHDSDSDSDSDFDSDDDSDMDLDDDDVDDDMEAYDSDCFECVYRALDIDLSSPDFSSSSDSDNSELDEELEAGLSGVNTKPGAGKEEWSDESDEEILSPLSSPKSGGVAFQAALPNHMPSPSSPTSPCDPTTPSYFAPFTPPPFISPASPFALSMSMSMSIPVPVPVPSLPKLGSLRAQGLRALFFDGLGDLQASEDSSNASPLEGEGDGLSERQKGVEGDGRESCMTGWMSLDPPPTSSSPAPSLPSTPTTPTTPTRRHKRRILKKGTPPDEHRRAEWGWRWFAPPTPTLLHSSTTSFVPPHLPRPPLPRWDTVPTHVYQQQEQGWWPNPPSPSLPAANVPPQPLPPPPAVQVEDKSGVNAIFDPESEHWEAFLASLVDPPSTPTPPPPGPC